MLTVLLVRHASCDHVGRRIAGREPGVHLNGQGRAEADALAQALGSGALGGAGRPVAVYTSPLERAVETAEALARRLEVRVRVAEGLTELDFGNWTGRSLESLERDPVWRAFNEQRDATRIPGGELMAEAVARATVELERIGHEHPDATVAAVSHGDIIRGVLLHCLGMPLSRVHHLAVDPASVSIVRPWLDGGQVVTVNWRVGGPMPAG